MIQVLQQQQYLRRVIIFKVNRVPIDSVQINVKFTLMMSKHIAKANRFLTDILDSSCSSHFENVSVTGR